MAGRISAVSTMGMSAQAAATAGMSLPGNGACGFVFKVEEEVEVVEEYEWGKSMGRKRSRMGCKHGAYVSGGLSSFKKKN